MVTIEPSHRHDEQVNLYNLKEKLVGRKKKQVEIFVTKQH